MKDWLHLYGNRRVLCVLGLGYSSGLPLALSGATLQAWMVAEKIDLRLIGIFALVGLPYTLKVFWSPFMDRFVPPFLGRRRGWIAITQVLLCLTLFGFTLTSPSEAPGFIAFLALFLTLFSASQDIVIDAYRADVLAPRELGAGAATAVLGYRLAMLTSGALAMIMSDFLSWHMVYGIMAMIMVSNVLITLVSPEPEQQPTPPESLQKAIWDPLASYFKRSGAITILLFIVFFKLGDVLAASMTTPFLLDLGFSRSEVGAVYKAFGLVGTILGTFVGGGIISKIGINRSLWIFAFLQAVSNLSFTVLALLGKNHSAMVTAVAIENICGGMGTAGFVAFMMNLCDKRFTATQYALLTSLMGVSRVFVSATTGFLVVWLNWPLFYTVSVLGALPAIMLLPLFAPWKNGER